MVLAATSAFALPVLQLDIGGGTYVGKPEESTVAKGDSFSIYALLKPDGTSTLTGMYRISAALYPRTVQTVPAPSLGTFSFAGTSYNVTSDMYWGTPPEELLPETTAVGKQELSPHGIFDTYFMEFDIVFDPAKYCAPYDVSEGAGMAGVPTDFSGRGLYYQEFEVDVSKLDDGYGIHFDLYQVDDVLHVSKGNGKKCGSLTSFTTDLIQNAPYSHDAASGTVRVTKTVPDASATVSLLGLALLAIYGISAKYRCKI